MDDYTQEKYNPGEERRRARFHKKEILIDMNPMVDLAFLLLTFFMLTTTFSKPQTMEVLMPSKKEQAGDEQAVKESKAMSILLGPDDRIFWFMGVTDPVVREVSMKQRELRYLLLEQKTQIPGLIVLIKPSSQSVYKNLVDLLDELNICAIERYAVVDVSGHDQELLQSALSSQAPGEQMP